MSGRKERGWLEVELVRLERSDKIRRSLKKLFGATTPCSRINQNRPDLKFNSKISLLCSTLATPKCTREDTPSDHPQQTKNTKNTWTKVQCLSNWRFSFTPFHFFSLRLCLWRFSFWLSLLKKLSSLLSLCGFYTYTIYTSTNLRKRSKEFLEESIM